MIGKLFFLSQPQLRVRNYVQQLGEEGAERVDDHVGVDGLRLMGDHRVEALPLVLNR